MASVKCRAASKLVTNCLLFGDRFDQPGGSCEALAEQKKQSPSLGRGWEGDCGRGNKVIPCEQKGPSLGASLS